MLSISTNVAVSVGNTTKSADEVRQYVGQVASALEQQSAATREIYKSVQQASGALTGIDENIKRIAAG
jgi:methyl-accepting chemotaxis protein